MIADTCHLVRWLEHRYQAQWLWRECGYKSDLAYCACEYIVQVARSNTETTTALAVMHIRSQTQVATCTEILTDTLQKQRWKFPATVVWKSHFKLLPPQWICMQYGLHHLEWKVTTYAWCTYFSWWACDMHVTQIQKSAKQLHLSWIMNVAVWS